MSVSSCAADISSLTHLDQLAAALVALGCPSDKAAEMAAQLDRRAHQLAEQKGRSYDEALTHLLGLMKQGWAAKDQGAAGMIEPWKKISSTPIGDFRIFKLRSEKKVSPRTGKEHDFFVLDSPGWVNVIAITPDQQLVMVEQYRHGSDTVELEIPGGMMDIDEVDPVKTAIRELREETGYEGTNARVLGKVFANPAIFTNMCYTAVVENCVLKHPSEFDHAEDLITRLVPISDIPRLVAEEEILHPLVLVALYHFELWKRGLKTILPP
jgi:8-oxo-dGTP pyrophosphatase MutT (NUDIX family)